MEQPDWPHIKAALHAPCGGAFGFGDSVNVASGRLSFVLGLHGPCKTIDTACSSGLSAAHSAADAVRSSESVHAVAAAVSLKLRPQGTLFLAGGTVSPDGRCKTFDISAGLSSSLATA